MVTIFQICSRVWKSTGNSTSSSTFSIVGLFLKSWAVVLSFEKLEAGGFSFFDNCRFFWFFFFHNLRFYDLFSVTWRILVLGNRIVIRFINIFYWSFLGKILSCKNCRLHEILFLLFQTHGFWTARFIGFWVAGSHIYYLDGAVYIETISLNLVAAGNSLTLLKIIIQIFKWLTIKAVISLNVPMLGYMQIWSHNRAFFHMLFFVGNYLNLHFAFFKIFIFEFLELV